MEGIRKYRRFCGPDMFGEGSEDRVQNVLYNIGKYMGGGKVRCFDGHQRFWHGDALLQGGHVTE